jgi:hypothetical protein
VKGEPPPFGILTAISMIILYFHDNGVFWAGGTEVEVEVDRLLLIVTVAGVRVTSEVMVVVAASLAADNVDTS